jgi:hypothetical protein
MMYDDLIEALRCDYERNCWEEKCPYLESSSYNDCNTKRKEHDAADAIEELISRLPKWISVNERLPVSQELVIVSVCDTTGDTEFSYTSFGWLTSCKEYWIVDGEENGYVTHWMQLPEPPKGE